jgi:hypothetical protein
MVRQCLKQSNYELEAIETHLFRTQQLMRPLTRQVSCVLDSLQKKEEEEEEYYRQEMWELDKYC